MYRIELLAKLYIHQNLQCIGLDKGIASIATFRFNINTRDVKSGLLVADGG
jgi:hypothetical protein